MTGLSSRLNTAKKSEMGEKSKEMQHKETKT